MNQQIEDIKAIREMMEKSSKFQSINGLSLVLAGVGATVGGILAYELVVKEAMQRGGYTSQDVKFLIVDAVCVLLFAIVSISIFSWKKANNNHQPLVSSVTKRTMYNLLLPLVTGAIFSTIFLVRGDVPIVASTTLIFYGLALVNASKYTYSEIHALGICEIITGILAAIFLNRGIYFWIFGFGILHILFGLIMYFKYEVKKK